MWNAKKTFYKFKKKVVKLGRRIKIRGRAVLLYLHLTRTLFRDWAATHQHLLGYGSSALVLTPT